MPGPPFNPIWKVRLAENETDADIDAMIARGREKNAMMLWCALR